MATIERELAPASHADWLRGVDDLVADVERWAAEWLAERGGVHAGAWAVRRSEKQISEDVPGTRKERHYTVPMLEIDMPARETRLVPEERLVLEPIAYNVFGGVGGVDLYAWPTLYRVRLLWQPGDGKWIVRTDSGIAWPHPWNRGTFIELAEGLLDA